jgi:hypothetical protein
VFSKCYWDESEIETREMMVGFFTRRLSESLARVNNAFRFVRIETPILKPVSSGTVDGSPVHAIFESAGTTPYILRQHTTRGCYSASWDILNPKANIKHKLPLVVWEHGKVFSTDQDILRESYRLEFHILYSKTTAMSYFPAVKDACVEMILRMCGPVTAVAWPEPISSTTIQSTKTAQILSTIRERDDFWGGKNLEVIIDTDYCVRAHQAQERNAIEHPITPRTDH